MSSLDLGYRVLRRIVVAIVGVSVVIVGIAMLVLPGPAIVVIPTGLAILALEFEWARRWLKRARESSRRIFGGGEDPAPGDWEKRETGA